MPVIVPEPPGWRLTHFARSYTDPLTTDQQSAAVEWVATCARVYVPAAGAAGVVDG
jgi:hypothetical protein